MTPEEQYEFRLNDSEGIIFNGVPVEVEADEEETSATVAQLAARKGS
jgi:hypothetical protein